MTLLDLMYSVAVGGLFWGAAAAAEAGLRRLGLPSRLVWIVALAATVGAPFWGPVVAGPLEVPPAAAGGLVVEGLDGMVTDGGATSAAARSGLADRLAAALGSTRSLVASGAAPMMRWAALQRGWMPWVAGATTGLAALILLGGLVHLHRRSLRWRTASWRERSVWLARDFGPAVVGLTRPRPVLPLWALALDDDDVELIVRHEEAHARAGDPALLLAAATLAVLAPWNPAVWVQLRRLRAAVEVDCDARVLRGGVSRSRYGRLLVEVRARGHSTALPTPALLDSPESLERRLTTMFTKKTTLAGALPALIGAGILVVAACETPAPTSPAGLEPESAGTLTAEQVPADTEGFTVIEVEPTPGLPAPLVIVDGELTEVGLGELKALDIRSIEVVKGQAAQAHYGEDGAGGVVRVTTIEGEARMLGIPVQELRERLEAEKVARGRPRGTSTLEPAKQPFTVERLVKEAVQGPRTIEPGDEAAKREMVEVLPNPTFDVGEVEPVGVVKVRPATGTVRAEPTGEVSPRAALERSIIYVKRTGALIMVDGQVRDSWEGIDPDTIERIEVVKAGAARELYGERAAHGVVMIRTAGGD